MDSSKTAADSRAASDRRLVAQSDALTELTARNTSPAEHFLDRLHAILEISARALQVERLSLWEFDGGHTLIRCVGLLSPRSQRRARSWWKMHEPEVVNPA